MRFFYLENNEIQFKAYAFGMKIISIDKCKLLSSIDSFKWNSLVKAIKNDTKPVILWFDHCLNGGTEVYSQRELNERRKNSNIIRIRSNSAGNFYLTLITNQRNNYFRIKKYDLLRTILNSIQIEEVVINNLVGYSNSLLILKLIIDLPISSSRITINIHDFYCICSNYNLIGNDQTFCNLKFENCKQCVRIANTNISPSQWREYWNKFLCEYCSEIRVFSSSSADIIKRTFPLASNKIIIIPHYVPELRKARIAAHDKLNIAVLGNIGAVHKGRNIVIKLAKYLESQSDIKLHCFGEFDNKYKDSIINNIIITGTYKVDDLPDLCEKFFIDIILIPSIWPETFSYTTSEAIMTGLPVASFNFGAQAEKVNQYNKGLILLQQDPADIIKQIKNHLNQLNSPNKN